MTLLVPLAFAANGETVLPDCDKQDGPFMCPECKQSLILRQGAIRQWHFSHVGAASPDCKGGESLAHRAAKLILAKYLEKINFVHRCPRGQHTYSRRYQGCTAEQEFRYDGSHSADVAAFEDGTLKAILEVKATHATTGAPLESRVRHVGVEHVWEVQASRVVNLVSKFHHAKGAVDLKATNGVECKPCKAEWLANESKRSELREQREQEARERTKQREQEAREREKQRQEEARAAKPVIEFIDKDTVRRDGVLLKRKVLPAVCSKACYTWVEVDSVDAEV